MPTGTAFDWHTHEDHQLAWAASGVLTIRSETTAWVLPPSRALWTECTAVSVTPLVAELLGFLESDGLESSQRDHAAFLLVALIEPVSTSTVDVRVPSDERARRVAELLIENPADARTLSSWGEEVGASARTLARTFQSETGLPFGRWRALLRIRAAMSALATGSSVGNVANLVGYESVSAFVAAFRREMGVTPSAYFSESVVSPEASLDGSS
jgi:AraC-like DNA-binding protein